MGQKVNPISLRLPLRRNWRSRWYARSKEFPALLDEDLKIRSFLEGRLKLASVPNIFIERASNRVRVTVFTARPGAVIGRKGQDLERLKNDLFQKIGREVLVEIQEIKKPELVAQLVAENVALQLERRISFRRAMKRAVQTSVTMGAEGVRLQVSGRLGGADIARTEQQRSGRVPLHTMREFIDYGFAEARTVYGTIGVKCWLCLKKEDSQF